MSKNVFTLQERNQIEGWILGALAEFGPCTAGDLAKLLDLNLPERSVGWFCSQLRKSGRIEPEERKTKKRIKWRLATTTAATASPQPHPCKVQPIRKKSIQKDAKDEKIDPEHAAWMAYWSQPRAVRKLQEALGHAV